MFFFLFTFAHVSIAPIDNSSNSKHDTEEKQQYNGALYDRFFLHHASTKQQTLKCHTAACRAYRGLRPARARLAINPCRLKQCASATDAGECRGVTTGCSVVCTSQRNNQTQPAPPIQHSFKDCTVLISAWIQ